MDKKTPETTMKFRKEQVEFEIKNTIPCTLVPRKTKYLGINLTSTYKRCMTKTTKF